MQPPPEMLPLVPRVDHLIKRPHLILSRVNSDDSSEAIHWHTGEYTNNRQRLIVTRLDIWRLSAEYGSVECPIRDVKKKFPSTGNALPTRIQRRLRGTKDGADESYPVTEYTGRSFCF